MTDSTSTGSASNSDADDEDQEQSRLFLIKRHGPHYGEHLGHDGIAAEREEYDQKWNDRDGDYE